MPTTFAEIVDHVRQLDPEAKQELMGLLRQWLVQERRDEIRRRADEAESDHARGQTKRGNVEDLMADLYAEN